MIWQRLDPYRWGWRAFAVIFTALVLLRSANPANDVALADRLVVALIGLVLVAFSASMSLSKISVFPGSVVVVNGLRKREVASADVLDVRVERASVFFSAHLLVRGGTKVPIMAMGTSYNALSGNIRDISHLVSALNVAIAESRNPPADG